MTRSTRLGLAALLLLPALAACSPAPASPDSACVLIGEELVGQLVPGHERAVTTRMPGDSYNSVTCTVKGSATGPRTAELTATLERHGSCAGADDGSTVCNPPREMANRAYDPTCATWRANPETRGVEVTVPGVGRRACAFALTGPDRRLVTVHLLSQVDGDLVIVTYAAGPSTPELAVPAAAAVANNIWAAL
ncbi:hypothetical protein AB0M43_09015 [Longispora sp. NPDC051575]|uniref:hypothetical protein n=1 Tax=Longispora sp. NPDC051575 TaxID=3154943 RepID=UPI00342A59E9